MNGVDVSKSSHDVVVSIIRQSGDTVMMKVTTVTAASTHTGDNFIVYPAHSESLPMDRSASSILNGHSKQTNKSKTNGNSGG